MEYQKMLNLMNQTSDCRFVARNWIIVDDQLNAYYAVGNWIICSTEVLKSNLCDYNDSYTLVRDDVTIKGHNNATQGALQNCVSFAQCITKIDGKAVVNVEDLVMMINNMLEYSSN